jgi:hypothetical protein
MSSIHDIKYLYENAVYVEGAAAEHPDIAGQKEFASKADEILAKRKRNREQSGKNAKLDAIGRKLYNMNKIGEETELEEGMTMSDFKKQRSRQNQKEKRAADKIAPGRRTGIHKDSASPERAARHRANVDPDYDYGNEENDYPGGKLRPNKVRKAKALKELGERHMTSAERKKEEALGKKTDSAKEAMMKEYGTEKGKQIYYAWKRKQAMKEEIENLEEKARGTRPKKTVHAYDVDETLFGHGKKGKPNVQVHVKDASGKRVKSLSNQEFNTHKLDKGHSYDFSEFQSAKKFKETSSPNKSMVKDIKRKQARGQNVHLVTARSKFDEPKEFHGHLNKHGIDVPLKNIHYTGGMKGGDIGDKKVKVASAIAKKAGTSNIHMHDDAAKVHKSFQAHQEENPTSAKIKTHLVKPNKKGESMSRSYQATKEELLIKFPGKETIQNENKELSPYEYWNTFIRENKVEPQVIEEQVQEIVTEEETDLGSYSYWKSVLHEQNDA